MKLTGVNSCTSWMVAVACSVITCLNLSPYRLAGLMYVAIMEHFEVSRQQASIPIILFIMIRSLGGPIVGIIGQKYGIEELTLIGCFLAAVGFGGSFFARDIAAVAVFLGVIYGIGITFGNSFIPSIIKKHFTQNINSANGIFTAGSCVGAFIFPPIAVYLLDEYGVLGTFLIVSGIMLNGIPVTMLVVMARSSIAKTPPKTRVSENDIKKAEEKTKLPLVPTTDNQAIHHNNEKSSMNETQIISEDANSNKKLKVYNEVNSQKSVSKQSAEDIATDSEDGKEFRQISNKPYLSGNESEKLVKEANVAFISKTTGSHTLDTDLQQEFHQNGSQTKFNGVQNGVNSTENCSEAFNTPPSRISVKENQSILRKSLKIFLDPTFFIIMVIQSLHAYVLSLVWTTLIDYSRDKGIDRSYELYILMFHPLADLIGRLALGWVTDKRFLSLSKFTAFGFVLMALSTVLIVLSKNFPVMMTGALLFATISGALFSIMPSMVFEFMDKDQHIMGLTSRGIIYAPLSFTAAPLIGYFRGKLGSYDGLYYIFAGMCLICSAITPLMSVFSKPIKRKKEKSSESGKA